MKYKREYVKKNYIYKQYFIPYFFTATRVQILDEPKYISRSTNNLGKGIKPIILSPQLG